ncbi:hypothetical protein [Rubritalea tangerina]
MITPSFGTSGGFKTVSASHLQLRESMQNAHDLEELAPLRASPHFEVVIIRNTISLCTTHIVRPLDSGNAVRVNNRFHCFLREKRAPVLRFLKIEIHRLTAKLTIEYGGKKFKDLIRETIHLRRD